MVPISSLVIPTSSESTRSEQLDLELMSSHNDAMVSKSHLLYFSDHERLPHTQRTSNEAFSLSINIPIYSTA